MAKKESEKKTCKRGHQPPVFGCPYCIELRGPVYDNNVEAVLNKIEIKAQEMYEAFDRFGKAPKYVMVAVDEFYSAMTEAWDFLPD